METTLSVGPSRTGVSRSLLRLKDFRWLSANMLLASVGMMGEIVV
jgi:hypothetical protein